MKADDRCQAVLGRRGFALGLTAGVWQAGCAPSRPPQLEPKPSAASSKPPQLEPKPSVAPVLRALLADNRSKDPESEGGFSNHASMALSALFALGADAERLRACASKEAARVEPLRAPAPLLPGGFQASIGVPDALVGLIAYFQTELAARGRERVLQAVLPELLPGLSGALFHGLIRTAYALSAEEDAELAHALAYFTTVAKPIRALPTPQTTNTASAGAILHRTFSDERFRAGSRLGRPFDAMQAIAAKPGFDAAVAALDVKANALDDIAEIALRLCLGSHDLTTLHAVTSTHALRLLLPYVEQPELVLRYHFQAVLALGLTITERRVPEPSARPLPEWSQLVAAALASNDDHDIKLAFTCHSEATVRSPAAYQEVAAVRLGLL